MSEKNKQELQVAALKNGTVIDHIPSDRILTQTLLSETTSRARNWVRKVSSR